MSNSHVSAARSLNLGIYREKLSRLGSRELQDLLTDIGGSKFGANTRERLIDRILAIFLEESKTPEKYDVVQAIDAAYRSYKFAGAESSNAGPAAGEYSGEIFRLSRADPFSLTTEVILPAVNFPGYSYSFKIAKLFTFKSLFLGKGYDVQAWCLPKNDDVNAPAGLQWPDNVDLRVNGVKVDPAGGVSIAHVTKTGPNKIVLTAKDPRPFIFGIRVVKRRTAKEVMELVPNVGERLEAAVARVRRCVSGGDDDVEAVSDHVPVSLRCPMSGTRMKVAGRFKQCAHMGCFDLGVLLEMSMKSKKWKCPVCLKNYSFTDIIIDPYFNMIAAKLSNRDSDVNEVEVRPDGSWRAKSEDNADLGEFALWHSPDGTLCEMMPEQIGHDQFGNAKVIDLSDSDEDDEDEPVKTDQKQGGLARVCNLLVASSLKRAREEIDSSPFKRPKLEPKMYKIIDLD